MTTINRIKTVLTLAVVLGVFAAFSGPLQARVLVYEPFDYPDGWLTGQGGALGTTGTWVTTDTGWADGWRVHPEGELTGIVIDESCTPNVFDGTVDNLPTSGAFAGMPGPEDRGEAPCTDSGTDNLDGSIGLDPSVTATFTSGTTTWFSFVSVHAWDRNQGAPQFMIGTDTTTAASRGLTMVNAGNGIGGGGGAPRGNLFDIYPQFFRDGLDNHTPGGYQNDSGVNGGGTFGLHNGIQLAFGSGNDSTVSGTLDEIGQPRTLTMSWVATNPDGSFGAPNIVVGKIEWDADTGGEDIISLVSFLETDTLDEAAFDAQIALLPALSSRNWASNKPDLDQSQFDTLNFSSLKFFIDEIRIATTFAEVIGEVVDPTLPEVDAGVDMITWSGEPVQLDGTGYGGISSYAWSADPEHGVEFSDLNIEDPTVTITKATDNPSTVTLTLVGNGTSTDTMTIDIYDDACLAARAAGLGAHNPGDLNGNCITDANDLAQLSTKWLNDTGLTAAIIAPVTITVPNVTGGSESAAQSILTGLGLTTSSTYQYDEVVPLNDVITQSPIAGSEVAEGSNVSLVVSNGPPPVSELTIAGVYLAQTHVLRPNDPLFKLVGNRPTLLKVQVVGPNGTAVPPVTAVLSVDGETTTLTLDGPDTLPGNFEAALGKVDHLYNDSFTTLIPAEWIRPGLNISVTAGNATVNHNIKVGAPTEVKMKMFDVHYFGLGSADYPAGAFEELEAKWPVSSLDTERIRDIDFYELVVPARAGAPNVRVTSKQDYTDQTGLPFDGEQAAALQWVEALSASGGNFDVAMQYINIIGVPAGGQAGGFDGVGGISLGILNHELGHALSLPHWGDNASYPYKGAMYGIEPQPGVYMGTHVGPTWAFDLPSLTFIPPTVQENSVGGEVGYYKKSPMQGGGVGDQEQGFFFRHFSDYGVNRMQSYIEGKVAVFRNGNHYKWNDATGDYTRSVTSDGVRYPIEHDVQVISVMASTTLSDMNVNMVYPPIGPYEGNLILTFDPTNASDRATADNVFCPSGGCDFSLRVVQGGQQKTYMLPASGTVGSDPYSSSSLKTAAVNLRASDGAVTQVELLLTPNAEKNGLPSNPEVLHIWTD